MCHDKVHKSRHLLEPTIASHLRATAATTDNDKVGVHIIYGHDVLFEAEVLGTKVSRRWLYTPPFTRRTFINTVEGYFQGRFGCGLSL